MMQRQLRRPAVILSALALGVAGCGGDEESESGSANKGFNETDVTFVQKMLPHHMQALRTSEIVIEKGADPRVGSIARGIVEAQEREIATMQGFLEKFGASEKAPPADQQKAWDENVEDERDADSPEEVDRVFLTNMVPHHAAAVPMSQLEIEKGSFGPAIKLAEEIKLTQRQEIQEMVTILRAPTR